jgi:hypothetical protein
VSDHENLVDEEAIARAGLQSQRKKSGVFSEHLEFSIKGCSRSSYESFMCKGQDYNLQCCSNIYKIIILSVVLYGCKTWSLTLRE